PMGVETPTVARAAPVRETVGPGTAVTSREREDVAMLPFASVTRAIKVWEDTPAAVHVVTNGGVASVATTAPSTRNSTWTTHAPEPPVAVADRVTLLPTMAAGGAVSETVGTVVVALTSSSGERTTW